MHIPRPEKIVCIDDLAVSDRLFQSRLRRFRWCLGQTRLNSRGSVEHTCVPFPDTLRVGHEVFPLGIPPHPHVPLTSLCPWQCREGISRGYCFWTCQRSATKMGNHKTAHFKNRYKQMDVCGPLRVGLTPHARLSGPRCCWSCSTLESRLDRKRDRRHSGVHSNCERYTGREPMGHNVSTILYGDHHFHLQGDCLASVVSTVACHS